MASSPSRDPGLDSCLRQQEVLADLGDRALASGDLDTLCADAVAAVAETLGAKRCAVIERLPDGRTGYLRAATGLADERGNGDSIPLSQESVLGQALASPDPVVVDDLAAEAGAADSLLADGRDGGSAIAVAIGRPDDPWGVLAATASEPGTFSEVTAPFLANVANVVASAIEQDHRRSDVEEIYGRISDAFFALDDEWRFSYLNDHARELIAPDDRSLLGRNVWEEFPEAVESQFKSEYERAMREQETVSFEEYYPDPIDAWVEVRAYPSESGLSVYFRDVTERREAQQHLAEERDMFAEGPAIVFRWENEEGWPVEYVSENVEDAFGYTPEELESGEVPYTDLLLEEEMDRIASEVAENSADEGTDRFSHDPYRIRTKDGDVRWVTDTTKIIRNDEGEITGYLGYLVDITERKEREEELRRYEAIVEAVDDGVYVVDENGEFTMANEAYAEMTGYDREELIGEHVSLVVDDEVLARAQQTEAAMREDAVEGVTLEAELETKGGERFPAEASFAMLPTLDGETQRRIGVVRDITDRKERERELRRYERIVENLPVGVYRNTPGPDGEFVAGNERLASIFDADSPEELMEYNVSDLYADPEERAAFSETLSEEGMVEDYELPQVTLDGREIWISVTAIEVEEDGQTYFDGVVQDVTERIERERELERFETLFTESTDVNAVLSPDGTFEYLPPSVENVLGYDQEDLLGEDTFEYVHPDDRERIAEEFQRMVDDPEYRPTNEFRYRHADGSWVWLSSTGRNLLDDPAIEGLVVYTRDVTERKRRERQLAERERQLSTLIDNVPGMVYRHRNERGWPMEFVSDGCLDVTGYDPAALERGEISFGEDIVHEEDRERLWNEVQEGLNEDGSFHVTYRIVTPEDNVRWVRERGRRVTTEDGTERVEGVVIDITERKRLESELDEVFGRVTDAFYALDEEWRFTHVNERAEELLGHPEEELLGETLWDAFPESRENDDVRECFERAMATQEPQRYEAYSEPRDFWVDATVYPSETGVSVYFEDATERVEREQELERTERRFEAIFEDPNILVGLLEPDGTVIDINDTAMEYIDADLADVTGELFWETPWWGEGDDVQDDVMDWTERAADGEYVDFETDLTQPNGEEYTLNGVFRPVTNDDGDVVSVIVSDRDVTERREYERQLAESERRYRTIADYFPNGIVTLFDHDLEYTLAAGQGFADMPVDPDDVEGHHFSAVWGEEIAADLEPVFEGALEGEERTVELGYEGREWIVHGVPITDERGDVFAGMTMARDITERKERERELAKYETIVETINDGIYVKDAEGYFTMVNDAYAELTGYDREELVGSHASLVVDEETMAESSELRTESGDASDNPTMEAEIQRADGTTVPTEGTFAQLDASDDDEAIGVVRDISERIEQRRRIEESERRYRTLVENFPNGAVGLFDENLEYTAVGGEFLDQAAIPKEERIGNRVSDIYPEEIVEEIEPYFQAAIEGEKNSFEVEYHDSHLFAYTLPVRNAEGEVDAGMLVVQDVTDRREAERELRESEARFRMLAENLDEIVWMGSPDAAEFIYVNPAFEEVWGIDRETIYDEATAFLEYVHETDRDRVERAFQSLPEDPFDEEFRIVRPEDDEVRWVHATGALVHDTDAEMVRVVGTGQDVTERVERERQLEESERRYRTLAEHFPNGAVGVYDGELRYTLAEGEMLGENLPSAEALEGDRMPDIFPEETVADLEPLFRAAVEDGETGSVLTEFGERNWQVWATPLRDADGEVFAGLSLAQDVTEQIERERELERALDLLEKTERIADVGGWEIDMATEEVFWTDHIFNLLEVEGEEEPPLDEALDMYHDEDQQFLQEKLDAAMADQEPFDVEARLRTAATRDDRWLRLQGAPEVEDGQVVAIRGAAQDITDRKQREQRLEELIDRLEESNERLEQFAYAASHDLQEPLRMVSSYLQLIERRYADELDEDGQEFIDFAVDGADRMRDMINGLLQYSRVDTRGEPFEPVDLDDVLADARDDLQVRIEETDAEITTGSLPTVEADDGQVRQVFQNLLDNAIEYSGDGPPRVHVDAERRGDEWAISVTDEGIGIDPADADQIFEVFNSLHSTGEHSGTGIGLALCERIVERHGGEIWVDSEPGEGSTFTFTLPAHGDGSE